MIEAILVFILTALSIALAVVAIFVGILHIWLRSTVGKFDSNVSLLEFSVKELIAFSEISLQSKINTWQLN